jgi:hypothetical protein
MEFLGNLFKGIGILILAFIAFLIWSITGPHSHEEVLKDLSKFKQDAERAEMAGDSLMSQGYISFIDNPRKCIADFKAAFYSYLDANEYRSSYSSYADKLGNWEKTKGLQREAKERVQKRLQVLEGKIKASGNPPCK